MNTSITTLANWEPTIKNKGLSFAIIVVPQTFLADLVSTSHLATTHILVHGQRWQTKHLTTVLSVPNRYSHQEGARQTPPRPC